jgi:hypothetical protein
MNFAIEGQP